MTTRYVGAGGNDANSGTSWAQRKLTLNGVEDTPVVAGDTVYVGPGTYRELLTVDVSGSVGSPITYIGDYTGENTDGVGGLVRITGAANETTTGTRANCISASSKNYRTFTGFQFDGVSAQLVDLTSCQDWAISKCVFLASVAGWGVNCAGANQLRLTVSRCVFAGRQTHDVLFTHSSAVDNAGHVVESCAFVGTTATPVNHVRVGGTTIRNCTFIGGQFQIRVTTAITVGQTVTVNNCIFYGATNFALVATVSGEIVEDYNTFHVNSSNRSNVASGANSVTYPPGFDMRPYLEALDGGTLALPWSLASYSGLVEYSAGTGAPSTDIRGHAVAGSLREWGAEEYVSTYTVAGGGGVTMWPLSNSFIGAILGTAE